MVGGGGGAGRGVIDQGVGVKKRSGKDPPPPWVGGGWKFWNFVEIVKIYIFPQLLIIFELFM